MIPVRGRVPRDWTDKTAAHLTDRLQAIERELSGARPTFTTPSRPTFGSGSGATPPSGSGGTSGSGAGGGVTDHGALTGLLDDDHPIYQLRGEESEPSPHVHLEPEIQGLDARFVQRNEAVLPEAHLHLASDVVGLPPQNEGLEAHVHVARDVVDLPQDAGETDPHTHRLSEVPDFNLWEMMLWREVYGG